jgi:hypothetical protein
LRLRASVGLDRFAFRMADRRSGSEITKPGYRKGIAPPNKGRKLPAEILTVGEVERLMDAIPKGKVGVRNRAMVALMVRAGIKIGQVVAMERYHYEPETYTVIAPAGKLGEDRRVPIDSVTLELLDHWMEVRRGLKLSKMAPLFASVSAGSMGNRLWAAYVRDMLAKTADKAGIEKRVTPSGLVKTYQQRTAERSQRMVSQLVAHIDEATFASRYPLAYEKWRMAFDLYELAPEQATRIGHDCREAILEFANSLLALHRVDIDPNLGTKIKVRAVFDAQDEMASGVTDYVAHLLDYWRAVSDLAQRQEHAASREKRPLGVDDARRLVFQTLVVMAEIDSALQMAR